MDLSHISSSAASAKRLRERIHRDGYTPRGLKVWSKDEDDVIRSCYPNYAAITEALPHRTLRACRGRARRLAVADTRPPFTAKELLIVRRLYPAGEQSQVLAALPGRDWTQIAKLANRHRIHRRPKSLKPTGVPVLDQIRERCRELNYTMSDLDKMIKGRGYFGGARWSSGHIHHRDIGRAVMVLFGEIRADWK